MLVGALDSVVGQIPTTLLGQDISACALEVIPVPIKRLIVRVTTDGASTLLDSLTGEAIFINRNTGLGMGTGVTVTRQA